MSAPDEYDVIIVGCGAAGAGAALSLGRSHHRTLVLEQFRLNHLFGSTHGESRIFRTSYHEGRLYVPLSLRAQELWRSLAPPSRGPLIQTTGGLYVGSPDSPLVAGAVASAEHFSLRHEVLSSTQVHDRFPAFTLSKDEVGFWEPAAGWIRPDMALEAMVAEAAGHGAKFHFQEPVTRWNPNDGRVLVETPSGSYRGKTLILCAGPWSSRLVPELAPSLTLERQVVYWLPPKDRAGDHVPGRMPVFLWQTGEGRGFYYGVPDLGGGVKVGSDVGRPIHTPEEAVAPPKDEEYAPVRDFIADRLPGLDPTRPRAEPCLYTNSPDRHFLVGPHPRWGNVVILSACSGHGFKFAPAVGELAAHLATGQPTADLPTEFDPSRLFYR